MLMQKIKKKKSLLNIKHMPLIESNDLNNIPFIDGGKKVLIWEAFNSDLQDFYISKFIHYGTRTEILD
jgi:hypothetical protein